MAKRKVLERGGENYYGHQFWKFNVPDDWLTPGLEINIKADTDGISIGGELITWDFLEKARAKMEAIP